MSERSPEAIAFVDVILQTLKTYIASTDENEVATARQRLIELFIPMAPEKPVSEEG